MIINKAFGSFVKLKRPNVHRSQLFHCDDFDRIQTLTKHLVVLDRWPILKHFNRHFDYFFSTFLLNIM